MITPQAHATATLRHHGKSFHWAGQLLSNKQFDQGARLYHICRQVDDWADEADTESQRLRARHLLETLHQRILHGASGAKAGWLSAADGQAVAALDADILALFAGDEIARHAMADLLETMLSDLLPVQIADESALLAYAYGAAGTVGVMMCHCLDARHIDRARLFAMDLGMAMQMTNIARDVLEDALRGRVYLPKTWLGDDVDAASISQGEAPARHQAWLAAKRLVHQADAYYASGWNGLAYLPPRARLAMAVALRVYRQIGRRILAQDEPRYWSRRVTVSMPAKCYQSLIACVQIATIALPAQHNRHLHAGLDRSRWADQAGDREPRE